MEDSTDYVWNNFLKANFKLKKVMLGLIKNSKLSMVFMPSMLVAVMLGKMLILNGLANKKGQESSLSILP